MVLGQLVRKLIVRRREELRGRRHRRDTTRLGDMLLRLRLVRLDERNRHIDDLLLLEWVCHVRRVEHLRLGVCYLLSSNIRFVKGVAW